MLLRCPKCGKELIEEGRSLRCGEGHSYDIAREGYVNLVLANQKHSRQPGDNDDSLKARRAFLSVGYYQPLAEKISELIGIYFSNGDSFLDAGCGTGYYLDHVMRNCGRDLDLYAVDIAKKGVAMCARLCRSAHCFVGNVFHLPFESDSLNGLMSIFTPYSADEFFRIVKPDGFVISVTPGARHLYELKATAYEKPYLNEEKGYDLPGFRLIRSEKVTYMMHLADNADIATLWRMMPYYHTTSKEDNMKVLSLEESDCVADFLVNVYQKD